MKLSEDFKFLVLVVLAAVILVLGAVNLFLEAREVKPVVKPVVVPAVDTIPVSTASATPTASKEPTVKPVVKVGTRSGEVK